MKVMRGALTSIGLALVMAVPQSAGAAEAATCAETWYLCINDTEQIDGYIERTWAEQKCNYNWYNCVKKQAFA